MDPGYGHTTVSMLTEIDMGTAAEMVMSVRKATSPPGLTFIPALDDIIQKARPHPGALNSSLQRGDLVEITGPTGSGKTSLLNFLLVTSLLPSSMEIPLPPPILPGDPPITVMLGGKSQHAVLLQPTSHCSPVPAIARRMQIHVESHILDILTEHLRPRIITPPIRASIDTCIAESLSRLRIIKHKPRWKAMTLSLLTVLRGGPDSGGLDLVVCDGFGDAFWPERWIMEEKGKNMGYAKHGIRGGDDVGIKDVLGVIENLRRELGAVVIVTTQLINTNTTATQPVPHLEAPFPYPFNPDETSSRLPLDIQIILTGRVRPLQFPAEVSLVDALRALEVQPIGQGARYKGVVRIPNAKGKEETSKSANGKQGSAASVTGANFEFDIGDSGFEAFDVQQSNS